ncbi:uroporphyrinogen-III synthase [Sphingomonas sp. MG17]|uniref:Uroporphyrinogen-III synthase n=1 Tax=Sphingomonas tagetis TaxID=2949092 RepID=A0A9X2HKZ6_9SPHN|nr:uroporphyrinogen-III synthase [Sphingomonas tagetis]MCP3731602.1 uroporphyrinogen-III synthase [Sphingomonas tagetis]
MTRAVAVLRPEPGNRATVERLHAAGLTAIPLPLFEVAPVPWTPPDPAMFDRLLLTSANAVRHGGPGLSALQSLPVLAVGSATAAAARAAGFAVETTGSSDVADLLAGLGADLRLLWLSGRDRTAIHHPALAQTLAIYRADPRPIATEEAASLANSVALLHSARAASRLADELDRRGIPRMQVRVAALSAKVAQAAGPGWAALAVAAAPHDDALIAAARPLAIDP